MTIIHVATGVKAGPPSDEIARCLAWQNIRPVVRELTPRRGGVGEVILSEAAAVGADLLVMGAYSHNRFREAILGGVTKQVIADASLPILMTH